MLSGAELDEIVFQILLSRMTGKKPYRRPIKEETVLQLCEDARQILTKERVMLKLNADIAVVGDIHGNVDDLIRTFERLRYPPAMRYLFLGDYIDRGPYGTEVLILLLALKCKFPEHIYLLRGNHECAALSRFYGFSDEIVGKYSETVYRATIVLFRELPLAAVVGERVFCVHGGLSPSLRRLSEFETLAKPLDFADKGLFQDMVWSDPRSTVRGFVPSTRNCGMHFGPEATRAFLDQNDLDLVIRSHEMCMEGISWPFANDETAGEKCLTVFSNTNYCDMGNTGAILHISTDLIVNVEVLSPLTEETARSRHTVLPYWLSELIAQKEKAPRRGRRKVSEARPNGENHCEHNPRIMS
jgi:protein phosphatase